MKYQIEENNVYTRGLYWIYFRSGFGEIKNSSGFITARDEDKIVGAMGFREFEPGMFIYKHLVVHPDYRRQGIGTSIIQQSVRLLKEKGAWLIRNHKSNEMLPRSIFYELGFKLSTTTKMDQKTVCVFELNLL